MAQLRQGSISMRRRVTEHQFRCLGTQLLYWAGAVGCPGAGCLGDRATLLDLGSEKLGNRVLES
jgi:hypothetical protein